LEVLDINLTGASYTSLLALQAFRRNPIEVQDCLLVLTSSGAGIYPTPVQPFYAAAKHAIIGLARSMGERHADERIRVCALVPGLVPTPIMPKEIIDRADKSLITPISHIVVAINDMLQSDRNATVCEASVDQLFYRDQPKFPDEAQRRVIMEISRGMGDDFKKVREGA
jgi:NAD(P)-dependent dehydrogenase (short-subunit alcohol dehydrogenase family)